MFWSLILCFPFCSYFSLIFLVVLLCTASLTPSLLFSLQVDRLMELHFKYLEGVQQADKRIEGEKHVSILFSLPFSRPVPLVLLSPLSLLHWMTIVGWMKTMKLSSVLCQTELDLFESKTLFKVKMLKHVFCIVSIWVQTRQAAWEENSLLKPDLKLITTKIRPHL